MRTYHNHFAQSLPNQQSWRQKQQKNQALDIEIGAGAGMHALQYGQQNPERFLIAIEKTRNKFAKFINEFNKRAELQHSLLPIHGNVTHWLPQHITALEVSRYFILYPCPYPKPKQANKRWFNMPFMAYILETLKPKGTITLATDQYDYYLESLEQAQSTWQLNILQQGQLPSDHAPRTHFEKKYLERGKACYQFIAEKV